MARTAAIIITAASAGTGSISRQARARAWHTHPNGQVIHVTEGLGLAQRRGGAVEQIRAGDSVRFEPGEEHWHGAAPMHFMSHLALHEADEDGVDASWGEHVTDAEYNATPAEKP